MRFGLIANVKRSGAEEAIDFFIRWADKSGTELFLCDELSGYQRHNFPVIPKKEIASQVDIIVSMGGDGTFLSTARAVGNSGTPLLGINLGSLGFLTQLTPHQLLPALDSIVKGQYTLEKRMLLKADVNGIEHAESRYALNDIVIDNGPVSRLIDINLSVNGEDIVTYKADGLIIATPTGSTAYALAVGGPIMHPRMEAMIAAPISSFSLTTRPMVFAPDDKLVVRAVTQNQATLSLDGQVMLPLDNNPAVTITRADYYINLVVFPDSSFYKVLKNKLHWGYTPFTK